MKKINLLLIFIFTSLLIFTACKKDEVEKNIIEDNLTPYEPNANDLIVDQYLIGNEGDNSAFWEILETDNGQFFFYGVLNDDYVVGKISAFGSLLWERTLPFKPKGIVTDPYNSAIIVVGNTDIDNDNSADLGYVELYDENNGLLISQAIWDDYDNIEILGVTINVIEVPWNGEIVYDYTPEIFGRCQIENVVYPFIATFSTNQNSLIEKETISAFTNLPSQLFIEKHMAYTLSSFCNGTFSEFTVTKSSMNFIESQYIEDALNMNVLWSSDLVAHQGLNCGLIDFILDKNTKNTYIVGYTWINQVTEPATEIDILTDAFLASVDSSGGINYLKTFKLSNYGDYFTDLALIGNYLYIGGLSGYLSLTNTADEFKYFGNGNVSKVVASTGDIIDNFTFGNKSYASTFNDMQLLQNTLYCAGTTKGKASPLSQQGWLVKINIETY